MIGAFIVVISFVLIYYNIHLPNALKGFLFFIQVIHVYNLKTYMYVAVEQYLLSPHRNIRVCNINITNIFIFQ